MYRDSNNWMHIRPVPHPCMKHMDVGELDWVVSCESSKPRDQQVSVERVDFRLRDWRTGEGAPLPFSSSSSIRLALSARDDGHQQRLMRTGKPNLLDGAHDVARWVERRRQSRHNGRLSLLTGDAGGAGPWEALEARPALERGTWTEVAQRGATSAREAVGFGARKEQAVEHRGRSCFSQCETRHTGDAGS
ncbi:hypothetical protein KC345_g9 [Hortaea werneckii]|nr:hypothetical protein KC345_g9 [Hortaea werneckii]